MINLIVLPMVVLLLILLAIYVRKNMHIIIKPPYRKRLLLGYIAILMMATIGFFFIQSKVEIEEKVTEEPPYLYNLLDGEIDWNVLEPFKQQEWEINVKDEKITLDVQYNNSWVDIFIPVVIVEDTDRTDNAKIEYYQTPTLLNGYDISEHIDIVKPKVATSELVVHLNSQVDEYKFQSIQKDMLFYQFHRNFRKDMSIIDFYYGEKVFVLYVPVDTAVVGDFNHFDIIRK